MEFQGGQCCDARDLTIPSTKYDNIQSQRVNNMCSQPECSNSFVTEYKLNFDLINDPSIGCDTILQGVMTSL